MRIRYTVNKDGTWTSRKTVTGPDTNYTVSLNPKEHTYLITGEDGSTVTGSGDTVVELKKNVRFALTALGVHFEVEKRNTKIDTFDLDTHANLAANVS